MARLLSGKKSETKEKLLAAVSPALSLSPVAEQPFHSVILDEAEAIEWALNHAPENGLVVILPESVSLAIELIKARNPLPDGFDSVEALAAPAPKGMAYPSSPVSGIG